MPAIHPEDITRIANVWHYLPREPYRDFADYFEHVKLIHALGEVGAMLFSEWHPGEFWLEAWNNPPDVKKRGRPLGIDAIRNFCLAAFYHGAELIITNTERDPVTFYKHLGWTQHDEYTYYQVRPSNMDEILGTDFHTRSSRPLGLQVTHSLRGAEIGRIDAEGIFVPPENGDDAINRNRYGLGNGILPGSLTK